ncbi:hypothetical protein MJD09_17500, partial [bacterium]|nr:hypothetical protein [bacterium]
MENSEIRDPLFRQAVAAIDAGDLKTLEYLLANNGHLVCQRIDYGQDYFRDPYLLWFVAENPIRNGKLPSNIAQITRVILRAIERKCVKTLQEQIDYALSLVCSGRVVRECEVQLE